MNSESDPPMHADDLFVLKWSVICALCLVVIFTLESI